MDVEPKTQPAIQQKLGPGRHLGSSCLLEEACQQVSTTLWDNLNCTCIHQQCSREGKVRLCVKDAVWLAITREQESVPAAASTSTAYRSHLGQEVLLCCPD